VKSVLSGNEAFARGAYEAAVKLVSSYPGTPSTEITENLAKYDGFHVEWAVNEKVALEVALGASMSGARALTAMKHVGLNVAADPLMTASYTGVNGGLVIIVADDPNMYSSQNEQDSRHYARSSKLPMLEPSDSAEARVSVLNAFQISEEYGCPVLVRSVTRVSHSLSVVETGERTEIQPIEFQKDPLRWVMTPVNARARHKIVEERLVKLRELSGKFAEEYINGREIGIITSGASFNYVMEAMPEASALKLGMIWPLPIAKIKEFAGKVDKLYVVEELDSVIETELLAAGISIMPLQRDFCGELSVDKVMELFGKKLPETKPLTGSLPLRLPNMCAGCSHRGIFFALNKLKLTVLGDIGCYTLGYMPPLSVIDSCICMGASASMAHGFDRGTGGLKAKHSVGILGDSTFLHTGFNGLISTVYNQGVSTLIILDNRITGMTGHQPNPGSGFNIRGMPAPKLDLEALCRAIGVKYVRKVDPFDPDLCVQALKEETAREDVSVIIAERSCIFIDKAAVKSPYEINAECSGCKMCLRLGCPAISWNTEKRKALISEAQCTGCGLCPKVCKFDAINSNSKLNAR
jgi:indolepyruvate ferredoxin oxidoreductase alpha subunit